MIKRKKLKELKAQFHNKVKTKVCFLPFYELIVSDFNL